MKKRKNKEKNREKVRRLPKFHVLDAVIILVIVAILAGIYFRYNMFDMIGNLQNQSEAQVTFSVKNIKDSTRYYIDIGDQVYFEADSKSFGTIMENAENSDRALSDVPASENFITDNGEVITVNYPSGTRIDVQGKIKCQGTFSEDGSFLLNGSTYLCPGQTVTVCTERVTLQITVTGIEKG